MIIYNFLFYTLSIGEKYTCTQGIKQGGSPSPWRSKIHSPPLGGPNPGYPPWRFSLQAKYGLKFDLFFNLKSEIFSPLPKKHPFMRFPPLLPENTKGWSNRHSTFEFLFTHFNLFEAAQWLVFVDIGPLKSNILVTVG